MIDEIKNIVKQSYLALLIGAIGGLFASTINMPLPWLLGPLLSNLLLSFTKIKITFSKKLLSPIFLIIGIIMGGTLNVSLLYKIHLWIFSSLSMIVYVFISTIIITFYFLKVCKFEKMNAILAALPGAFVPISTALLELKNNNNKRVLVPQATRVIFIVCMLPVIFIYQMGNAEIQGLGNQNIYDLKYFIEIVLVCFGCYIFALFLKKFNIPSSTLLSGMIISGILYTLEFVNARFPDIFINISFIFLGTALGSRLNGLKIKELLFYIFHGVIITIILMTLAAFASYFLEIAFGFDFLPTFLSFVPGGLHEMVIISVAYNIDPIFVSYHHFLRIILIVLLIPFIIKKFNHNE